MFYQQDWFMRQIEMMIDAIVRVILKKDVVQEKSYIELISESGILKGRYEQLHELIAKGELCRAENELFDKIDTTDFDWIIIALKFYDEINRLSDEELAACNFSREEIEQGICDLLNAYGIDKQIFDYTDGMLPGE